MAYQGGYNNYGAQQPNYGGDWNQQGGYNNNNGWDSNNNGWGNSGYGAPQYDRFNTQPPPPPMNQGGGYDRFGAPLQGYNEYSNNNNYQTPPPPVPPPMQNSYDNGGGYQNNGGYSNGGGYQNNGGYSNGGGYQNNGGGYQQPQYSNMGMPAGQMDFSNRQMQFQPPPTNSQSFGVQGYNFQYSNCSGRRKALLIGINYIGQKNALRGCINDVHNVRRFLLQHGYKDEDMVILTDDQRDGRCVPTRANILRGMQWLVRDARTNDSLFLHYSGHGGQTEDLDGDEDDGYDEVIYPVDYQRAGHIVDDEIHATVVRPLMPGVRLTALFDSCHSGTVMDLPYVYSSKGQLKEPNLLKEAGSGLLGAVMSYAQGDTSKMASSLSGLFKRVTGGNSGAYEKTKRTKTAPCDAIMLSGCKDSQTSADAFENGKATGAMSHAFIQVMSQNPNQSYLTLLAHMREVLEGKYEQKPQLSASHPIDVNLKFIF